MNWQALAEREPSVGRLLFDPQREFLEHEESVLFLHVLAEIHTLVGLIGSRDCFSFTRRAVVCRHASRNIPAPPTTRNASQILVKRGQGAIEDVRNRAR